MLPFVVRIFLFSRAAFSTVQFSVHIVYSTVDAVVACKRSVHFGDFLAPSLAFPQMPCRKQALNKDVPNSVKETKVVQILKAVSPRSCAAPGLLCGQPGKSMPLTCPLQ